MPIKFLELKDKASIEAVLGNLPQGDAVVLDIDNTLFRNAVKKYGDAPKPTEKNLSALLKYLRETGHPVILLTARKESHRDISLKQLEQLGFEYDELVHAPSRQDSAASNTATKGEVLANYLSDKNYKRLHVIDDQLNQLEAIAAALQQSEPFRDLKCFLYHYQPTSQLLQTNENAFPETLNGLTEPKSLGGGTESTYRVHDSEGQRFVLKHGDSEDQIKIEILMNALYKALGVPVAEVQAYDVIPAALAKAIKLPHTAQTVQLAEFVQAAEHQDDEKIKTQARRDFAIHAFMGNIDITKTDNFIQTPSGEIKLIDAGANFIFRAKGERRDDVAAIVEELHTLRDKAHNASGAIWFKDLSDTEIEAQVKALIDKRDTIEETLWTLSRDLELPASVQRQLINGFSHRLDSLAQLYGFTSQRFAKRDKGAIEGKTAAGVMHLQRNEQGELCVLLSKRVRHNWWDNFGGKSDAGDASLAFTAQRECKEESNGLLQYSDKELADAPFHDIVTTTSEGQTLYRMYFVEGIEPLDISQLNDQEHTEHHWLPLSQLKAALQVNEQITEEGKSTIKVKHEDNDHIVFPPLYDMLKQAPVQRLIDGLIKDSPAITRTQGLATTPEQKASAYKPLTSTARIREDVTATLLNKSGVLNDIKHHRHRLFTTAPEPAHQATDQPEHILSPSELHLKAVMGDDFKEDNAIEENVACFLEKYSPVKPQAQEIERLIRQAVEMIEHERDNPDSLFFYHGVNHDIAYAYSVYTALYRLLEANSSLDALRTDNALFHRCLDIQTFIAHFESMSQDGKVYNYDAGYMECALSCNPFLFGSHDVSGSNTIAYYINNDTTSKVDIKALFKTSLQSMGVDKSLINRIMRLHQISDKEQCGRLYQMAIPKDHVNNYAYAAAPGGRLNPLPVNGKEETTEKTTHLTDVIDAMRDGRANPDYIAALQARVMVPPNLPMTIQSHVWSDDQEPDEATTLQRKHLTKNMAYDILQHQNQFNKLNSKSALLRYLPDILAQTGLSADDTRITDDVVVQLIESADFESLKALVALHPEYTEKKLCSTTKHYTNRGHQKTTSAPLLERLLAIRNAGETIRAIFGDAFYEGRLDTLKFLHVINALPMDKRVDVVTANFNKIEHSQELAEVLESLFEKDRVDFAVRFQGKIRNIQELSRILKCLPEGNRVKFAEELQDNIKDGFGLARVLVHLPEGDKVKFAEKLQDIIKDGFELARVLEHLPEANRVQFAEERQGKIKGGIELARILKQLPEADRVQFAEKLQSHIKGGIDLASVLKQLPEDDRVKFAEERQGHIKGGIELAGILSWLPENCRVQFAEERQGKIKSGIELARVLKQLPEDDRIKFAEALHGKINDGNELAGVLSWLPENRRVKFAKELQGKIKGGYELNCVISWLPEDCRVQFADELQHTIEKFSHLACILHTIPESARLAFAKKHQDKIQDELKLTEILILLPEGQDRVDFSNEYRGHVKNCYELAEIIQLLFAGQDSLPKSAWLAFAIKHQDKVQNGAELAKVLEQLPERDRVEFAEKFKSKIKKSVELSLVLSCLPEDERVIFAEKLQGIIKGDYLAWVLERLPEANKVQFAEKLQGIIENAYHLACVLSSLPESSRLAFAIKNQDKIKSADAFAKILTLLPEDQDKVDFTKEYQGNVKNGTELVKILTLLPEGQDRVDFTKKYQDKVKNSAELVKILTLLPEGQDRIDFTKEYQGHVKNGTELVEILTLLPEGQDRMDFTKKYQMNVKNGTELVEILTLLPEGHDRIDLITQNQDKICNVNTLVETLKLLPEDDKANFTKKYQGDVRDGTELFETLKQLPENIRLWFASKYKDKIRFFAEIPQLLQALPANDRLEFAKAHSNMIKFSLHLYLVLRQLPANDRLAFTEHQPLKNIASGYHFNEIFNQLPGLDKVKFAFECKDKIRKALNVESTKGDLTCQALGLKKVLDTQISHLKQDKGTELLRIKYAVIIAQMQYERWSKDKRNADFRDKAGTFFSSIRHGKDGQVKANNFLNDIRQTDSVAQAIQRISDLLSDPKTRFHHHSFASFLLDEVINSEISDLRHLPESDNNRYDREAVIRGLPEKSSGPEPIARG